MSEQTVLRKLTWLLERMSARKRRITLEQAQRFGRHPQGPILPDMCLVAERIPDECCRDRHPAKPICGLSVSAKGEPCYATVIDKKVTIICGKKRFVLDNEKDETGPGGESLCERVEILGYSSDGAPYTLVHMQFAGAADFNLAPSSKLYKAEKLLGAGVTSASLLSSGTLVYAAYSSMRTSTTTPFATYSSMRTSTTTPLMDVYRNDAIWLKNIKTYYYHYLETPDGRILSIWWDNGRLKKVAGYFEEEKPFKSASPINDIVLTKHGARFIMAKECGLLASDENGHMHSVTYFGTNPYRSNYTELPDDRVAYIGEPTRDKLTLTCWIIGGTEEQPGFELVSPLFERHGRWCYYGVIGRHLYTMAIPDK